MRSPQRSGATSRTPPSHRCSRAYGALVAALLLAVALVPLWSVDIPPLTDYPNHLARQYILANLPQSDHLQTFYQAEWRASPYLAMDAIVQGLARLVSVGTAGRIFLSLMFLLVAFAPLALNLALLGRVTPIALLGLLTIHNETLSLGFVNYLFSVGFALCLLGLWIRFREGRPWVRLLVLPTLSSLLFFSHLIGFGIYALTVGAYEFGRHVELVRGRTPPAPLSWNPAQRAILVSLGLQFLIPLGIFALFGPSATVVSQNTHGGIGRKLDLLLGVFSYLVPPYFWTLDRILVIALPATLLLLAAMRRLAIAKHMAWPLLAILLLFFAMPYELFGGFGADHRLLPAIGLLLAGSLTWRTTRNDRQRGGAGTGPRLGDVTPADVGRALIGSLHTGSRVPEVEPPERTGLARAPAWTHHVHLVRALALGLIVVLVVLRTAAVTAEWRGADREYADYVRAFGSLTDGSRVYYGFGFAGSAIHGHRPKYFVPCLALATKQVYLPYLFTSAGNPGIILKYTPEYEPLQRLSPGPTLANRQSPNWSAILGTFDYFLLGGERFFDTPVPPQLVPVYRGSDFTLYRNSAAGMKASGSRAGR